MTTIQAPAFESRNDILKPSAHLRVGVLAPLDECGGFCLDPRWAKPFEKAGIAVRCIPVGCENIAESLHNIHGLLLPGGDSNIHPIFYNPKIAEDNFSSEEDRDIDRDKTAIALIQKAYDLDIPTLGICRGMQEMIVAFGGQLQKLDFSQIDHAAGYEAAKSETGQRCTEDMDKRIHDVEVQPGGFLDNIYTDKNFAVNSIHHEGITEKQWASIRNKTARNVFRIEALAPDGVIEGISAKDKACIIGVQAHFELEGPLHDGLFGLFFEKVHEYKRKP